MLRQKPRLSRCALIPLALCLAFFAVASFLSARVPNSQNYNTDAAWFKSQRATACEEVVCPLCECVEERRLVERECSKGVKVAKTELDVAVQAEEREKRAHAETFKQLEEAQEQLQLAKLAQRTALDEQANELETLKREVATLKTQLEMARSSVRACDVAVAAQKRERERQVQQQQQRENQVAAAKPKAESAMQTAVVVGQQQQQKQSDAQCACNALTFMVYAGLRVEQLQQTTAVFALRDDRTEEQEHWQPAEQQQQQHTNATSPTTSWQASLYEHRMRERLFLAAENAIGSVHRLLPLCNALFIDLGLDQRQQRRVDSWRGVTRIVASPSHDNAQIHSQTHNLHSWLASVAFNALANTTITGQTSSASPSGLDSRGVGLCSSSLARVVLLSPGFELRTDDFAQITHALQRDGQWAMVQRTNNNNNKGERAEAGCLLAAEAWQMQIHSQQQQRKPITAAASFEAADFPSLFQSHAHACSSPAFASALLQFDRTVADGLEPLLAFRSGPRFPNARYLRWRRPLAVVVPYVSSQADVLVQQFELWNQVLPCMDDDFQPSTHINNNNNDNSEFGFGLASLQRPDVYFFNGHTTERTLQELILSHFHSFPSVSRCFAAVHLVDAGLPLSITHPRGPSLQFDMLLRSELFEELRSSSSHFLLLEPDTIPIRPRWLKALQAAAADKEPFWAKGDIFEGVHEDGRASYRLHINGNAIWSTSLELAAFHARSTADVNAPQLDGAYMHSYDVNLFEHALRGKGELHDHWHLFRTSKLIANLWKLGFTAQEVRERYPEAVMAHGKQRLPSLGFLAFIGQNTTDNLLRIARWSPPELLRNDMLFYAPSLNHNNNNNDESNAENAPFVASLIRSHAVYARAEHDSVNNYRYKRTTTTTTSKAGGVVAAMDHSRTTTTTTAADRRMSKEEAAEILKGKRPSKELLDAMAKEKTTSRTEAGGGVVQQTEPAQQRLTWSCTLVPA